MSLATLNPDWPAAPAVQAAFSLREGGVSGGPFATLNLGDHVGDQPAAVAENRRRLRRVLQLPAEPLWLRQVHGVRVCDADRECHGEGVERAPLAPADAIYSRCAGRVLAIMVADCLPILLANDTGTVIGAAHAGWRGLAAGVIEATVHAMQCDPARLCAWLGPAIGADRFEVGDEVRAAFLAADPESVAAFAGNPRGRWQCDLAWLAGRRLQRLGLRAIHSSGLCTHADATRFFSYRRDGQTGRMAALVWLRP